MRRKERKATMEVHIFDGFVAADSNHRALCTCGHITDPPASTRSQAAAELPRQHDLSPLKCARCGAARPAVDHYGAPRDLVLTVSQDGHCRLECTAHHADAADLTESDQADAHGPGLYLV